MLKFVGDSLTSAKDTAAKAVESAVSSAAEAIDKAVWKVRRPTEIAARTAGKYTLHAVGDAGSTAVVSAFFPPIIPISIGLHLLTLPAVIESQIEEATQETDEARNRKKQQTNIVPTQS